MATEVTSAREKRVTPVNVIGGARRSSLSGISSRTLAYASRTPNAQERIDAGIINRSTEMLMNTFGTANSSVNAERIRRATENMRRRFGYIR